MQKGQKGNHRATTSGCCGDTEGTACCFVHPPSIYIALYWMYEKKRRVNILDQPPTKKAKRRHAANCRWDLTAGFYFYTWKLNSCLKNVSP